MPGAINNDQSVTTAMAVSHTSAHQFTTVWPSPWLDTEPMLLISSKGRNKTLSLGADLYWTSYLIHSFTYW